MKKNTLTLILAVICVTAQAQYYWASLGQNVENITYDGVVQSLIDTVPNTVTGGINPSATAIKLTTDGTNNFPQVRYNLLSPITTFNGLVLKLKIRVDDIAAMPSKLVRIYLRETLQGTANQRFVQVVLNDTSSGIWQEYSFDFENDVVNGNQGYAGVLGYDAISIMYNFSDNTAGVEFYYEDIKGSIRQVDESEKDLLTGNTWLLNDEKDISFSESINFANISNTFDSYAERVENPDTNGVIYMDTVAFFNRGTTTTKQLRLPFKNTISASSLANYKVKFALYIDTTAAAIENTLANSTFLRLNCRLYDGNAIYSAVTANFNESFAKKWVFLEADFSVASTVGGTPVDYDELGLLFQCDNGTGADFDMYFTVLQVPVGVADDITTYTFNNNWSPANPSDGTGVSSTDTIVINTGSASLSSAITVNRLVVESGASLDLNGNTLTVQEEALISASEFGYGSVKGQISGTTEWQTYLSNGADVARWFNVGVPVNQILSGVSFTNGAFIQANGNVSQTNVWEYDASNITSGEGTWAPLSDLTGTGLGRGLSIYLGGTDFGDVPTTLTVTGSLNSGAQSQTLTPQGAIPSTDGYGWNFVSNPYAAPLDWTSVVGNNSDITTTYWILNANDQWVAYNSAAVGASAEGSAGAGAGSSNIVTAQIAPGQAFFVQAGNTSVNQINFAESDVSVDAKPVLYKTAGNVNAISVILTDANTQKSDLTYISFEAGDSDANDHRKDAIKRFNDVTRFPAIWSTNGQEDFIYNFTEDASQAGKSVDLNVDYGVDGSVLNLEANLDYFPSDWTIELEDKLTNSLVDLRAGNYTFTHTVGNQADRFVLHVNKNKAGIGLEESLSEATIYAYTSKNTLFVNITQLEGNADLILYNVNGQEVHRIDNAEGGSTVALDLNGLAQGVYIAKLVQEGKEVFTQKAIK